MMECLYNTKIDEQRANKLVETKVFTSHIESRNKSRETRLLSDSWFYTNNSNYKYVLSSNKVTEPLFMPSAQNVMLSWSVTF